MDNYLIEAINRLKPNSQFLIYNNDYSTIRWDVLEGNAPTEKEIADTIKAIKSEKSKESQAIAEAKSALLEKLGISEDEAKLLLS